MYCRVLGLKIGFVLFFVCSRMFAAGKGPYDDGTNQDAQAVIGDNDLREVENKCSGFLRSVVSEFEPGYDMDLLFSRDWTSGLYIGIKQVGNNPSAYVSWQIVEQRTQRNRRQDEIRETILRWGTVLCQKTNGRREILNELRCEGPNSEELLRLLRIAFLLNEIAIFGTDAEQDPNDIALEYRNLIQSAEETESLALRALTLRYFAQADPTGGDVIGNRTNCIKWIPLIETAISGGDAGAAAFQSLPTTSLRLAQLRGHVKAVLDHISKMDAKDLDRYETGRYSSRDGFVEETSTAAKRIALSEWYSEVKGFIDSLICSNAHKPFQKLPYELLESYAKELAVQMSIDSRYAFITLLDRIDSRHSKVSGFRHEYVQRKKIRHGEILPEATSLPPDPGRLAPYAATDALLVDLARYGLSAGMFVQKSADEPSKTNELAYLLFKPKGSGRRVPLVLFVPGSGELGNDLSRQFRQRTIFEKVTSAEFQKKHPCYLLVIAPPEDAPDLCGRTEDWRPGRFQRPFLSALACIAHAQKAPSVDTDRVYATGLSYGGRSIYGLSFVAPHLFAACVPVSSGVFSPEDVREERPGNWWHLYNDGDYARHPDSIPRLEAFAARVRELGGDFRIGTYPAEGHNAWDAAWREDALWDWMFSKSLANERPASIGGARLTKTAKADRSLSGKVVCTASKAGFDAKRGPERAADGLDATAYVSAVPMGPGDWWLCEFKEPVTGRIRVQTGWLDGTKRLSRGHVEVSKDGKLWSRAAAVSGKSGEASFQQRDPIRFVKLLTEPRTPEVLTLREMRLE